MNKHIKSALITFFVAFSIVLIPQLDSISMESFNDGVLVGILFAAVRAGVKGLLEYGVAYFSR